MKRTGFLALMLVGVMVLATACRGPAGPPGSPGPTGPAGATGPLGPAATLAPAVLVPPASPAPLTAPAPGPGYRGTYGFGRDATAEEIRAWDTDIMADGTGLPPGSGTAVQGAPIYAARCAACHGDKGQGGLPASTEVLVGTKPWFEKGNPRQQPPRTIGNYWPFATTIFDYTRRAMPFDKPGSLTDNEVYAVTAWLLWMNGIIGENEVMNAQSLPKVKMPNRDNFFYSGYPETDETWPPYR